MTTKQRPTQAKRWEAGPRCTSFSIGDLAREFDTTARTIRFYEANGLIRPARNGLARVYSERDRVRLKLILCGRRCGFSINEISEMLDLYDAPEGEMGQTQYVLAKLRDRREARALNAGTSKRCSTSWTWSSRGCAPLSSTIRGCNLPPVPSSRLCSANSGLRLTFT